MKFFWIKCLLLMHCKSAIKWFIPKSVPSFEYVNFLLYFIAAEIWFYASQSWDGLQTVVLCIQRTMKLRQWRFVIYLPEPFYNSCHWQSLLWLQPNTLLSTEIVQPECNDMIIYNYLLNSKSLNSQNYRGDAANEQIRMEGFVWWNSTYPPSLR